MNTGNTQQPARSDDIDLFNLIERALVFFRRYRWVFIIAIMLGLGAGYYLYRKIEKTYKSTLLVHSFFLTNQEEIQIVKTWNSLVAKKEFGVLANALNTDENSLRKLKEIKAKELQQVFSPTNPHGFTVEVVVTDNEVLDELQKGIVYGFENVPYVKQRMAVKRSGQEELILKTEAEIKKLEETKKLLEDIISGKGKISSPVIIDGSTISRQLVEMSEKLIGMKENLRYITAVQVLQDFAKYRRPVGPNLIPLLVICLVFFLGIAYVYALISSIRSGMKKRRVIEMSTQKTAG